MPHPHPLFSPAPAALGLAALLALSAAPRVRADVRYTTQMTMGDGAKADAGTSDDTVPAGMTMPGIRTTTYVKDMRERVETAMNMGPIHMNTVALTLCDKHQTVKMDPALKIYTVAPIGVVSFGPPAGRPGMRDKMPQGKPGVGHVVMTMSVQDMGTEKITDLTTHHFKMSVRTQTSGCLGVADSTMLLEEWVAPIKTLNCPERFAPTRTMTNEHGCQISYEMKGDFAKMREAYGGMVVRQKIYNEGHVIALQDLRDYSAAALDDALFSTPADYKQVSESEFADAQQKAMMKGMMGNMGDMLKGAPGDSADDGLGPDQPADKPADKTDDGLGPEPTAPAQNDPPRKEKKHGKFKLPGLPF